MTLKEWLKSADCTFSTFAADTGLAVSTVARLVHGQRRPTWPTIELIRRATGGAVTPNDWITERAPAEPAT